MATALANFARTGNPSQPGLAWPPADPQHNQTMVWDSECRMVNDPEGEARKILLSRPRMNGSWLASVGIDDGALKRTETLRDALTEAGAEVELATTPAGAGVAQDENVKDTAPSDMGAHTMEGARKRVSETQVRCTEEEAAP
jgi:hypothetical protein